MVRAATAAGGAALAFAVALRLGPSAAGGAAIAGPGGLADWMGPLVVALVVGGVIVAMGGTRRDADAADPRVACAECGGLVRLDWRLCPHCGARLGRPGSEDDEMVPTEGRGLDG